MILLVSCFIAGMLFLLACAEAEKDEDELDDEGMRQWVNILADESQRRTRKARNRYCKIGGK